MVFSSPTFLYVFLPLFFAIYFASSSIGWRNGALLAASLVFYAWGEPAFVVVLLVSIGVNWAAALMVASAEAGERKALLAIAVAVNLAILAIAKYADFAVGAVNALLPAPAIALPGIALPLGISFFTFHAISYVVDVYRRRAPAQRSLFLVALYISMFPQLVAGPIVRYRAVARQLTRRRSTLWRASAGMRIFVIGLAQKVLLANEIGQAADVAFALGPDLDAAEAWIGLACYSLQIYFDFAGYSSMAIGLALVLGFSFPRNFDMPYAARSVTEFWRRWHISLSRWFRDYLYIPLGGNRFGPGRTYANLWIVFLLCGLWHGASWNFVIWGAWHGGLLVVERAGLGTGLAAAPQLLRRAYLLLAVMLGWVWFRAETFEDARAYFAALAGRGGDGTFNADLASLFTPPWLMLLAVGALLALVPMRHRPPRRPASRIAADLLILSMFALSLIGLAGASSNPFLYFRF